MDGKERIGALEEARRDGLEMGTGSSRACG